MRYVVKTEKMKSIIEAVKWDGKIETINDNKWLEDEIKEDRVILAMNDEYDKEPLLLIFDSWTREYETVEAGDYVIKETHNQKHRIRTMKSDNFEEMFEVVEDKENNCVVVDLELNTEEFHKKLNEAKEELEKVLNYNIKDKENVLCSINNKDFLSIDKCQFNLKAGKYTLYLKREDNNITKDFEVKSKYLGTFSSALDKLEMYYLASNGKKKLNFTFDYPEDFDKKIYYKVEDESIVKIEDDTIIPLKEGITKVNAILKDGNTKEYNIMVTDLIVSPTMAKKTRLTCDKYTEEESALLDKILESRVIEAGVGSRAGVAAAARFLSLEFPYAIRYFYENGRLEPYGTKDYIDGEGRYYHKGLYLSKSKFKDIKASTKSGPAPWGCPLMEYSEDRLGINGLDCSGFVTWAMLNGGFESGDVGSENEELIKNELYDLGEHHEITTSYMKDGNYKPGDYIASDGHAALIVGVDEKYVYVAEAYYADVKVSKFEKYYELPNLYSLTFIIEMDKIYPNGDGLTTMMWD